MPAGCKKAYIAKGTIRIGFGGDHEDVDKEYVFLAWCDEQAPEIARQLAGDERLNLQKVFRVSDIHGYVEIPLN